MPDVFISYPADDAAMTQWANWVQSHLAADGRDVCMTPISGPDEERWSDGVLADLKDSPWAICLLTAEAAELPHVQQELKAASQHNGNIIPIVSDARRADLPGWLGDLRALGLREVTVENVLSDLKRTARRTGADTDTGMSIGAGLLGGLIFLLSGSDIDDD